MATWDTFSRSAARCSVVFSTFLAVLTSDIALICELVSVSEASLHFDIDLRLLDDGEASLYGAEDEREAGNILVGTESQRSARAVDDIILRRWKR